MVKEAKEKKDKKPYDLIKVAVAIIAACTPLLYIFGFYYEKGWLTEFGLGASVVDTSLQVQLLNFYSLLLHVLPLANKLIFFVFLAVSLWIIFTVILYVMVGIPQGQRAIVSNIRKNIRGQYLMNPHKM